MPNNKGRIDAMADEAYSSYFHLRLTPAQHSALDASASRLGISRPDYVRLLLSLPVLSGDFFANAGSYVAVDTRFFSKCFIELNRQGSNLNQAVKALNTVATRIGRSVVSDSAKEAILFQGKRAVDLLIPIKGSLDVVQERLMLLGTDKMIWL